MFEGWSLFWGSLCSFIYDNIKLEGRSHMSGEVAIEGF